MLGRSNFIVIIVNLVVIGAIATVFFLREPEYFPRLEAGKYIGELNNAFSGKQAKSVKIYVEAKQQQDEMLFVVMQKGWLPQTVASILAGSKKHESDRILPVMIIGPEGKLKLWGGSKTDSGYTGEIENLQSGTIGTWKLSRIENDNTTMSTSVDDLKHWLLLKHELSTVEYKIMGYEKEVPKQKADIEKLNSVITEGEGLRTKGKEKYQVVNNELNLAKDKLQKQRNQAQQLEEKFALARRVSDAGRLVSLARESLEREWRWTDSMLHSNVNNGDAEFERAVERADKITRLKSEIEAEKQKILALEPVTTEMVLP